MLFNTIFFKPLSNIKRNKLFFISSAQNSLFLSIQKFYLKNIVTFSFFKQKLALKNSKIANLLISPSSFSTLKFFTKYFYNGLGYKIFLRGLHLFV